MLRFFPIAFMSFLVNTNLCVKCARYLDELSLLCVLLYLWDTTSLLVRLDWSHLHEPLFALLYALLVLYCLAGVLCGCVRYTPLVIYFHIGAFMLMSDALISDLFPLLVLAAWIWVSFLFSCFYYGYLSVRYLSHPIYLFQHFTAYLGLGLCAGSPH